MFQLLRLANIWQLLNHTSGIPESQTYKQVKIGTDERLKEDTARIAEGIDLRFEPGTEFEYCNLNYDILAYLVEVASGERFEDYVAEEIFAPIGMTETGYDIPTAQGYQRCFWQTIEYDAPRFKGCQGDGYVITTTADMSLWIKAQLGQLELPEKLEKAIEKSHRAEDASQYINAEEGADCYYLNSRKNSQTLTLVAIIGKSGSGKTTLLNIIGCIDSFEQPVYFVANYCMLLLADSVRFIMPFTPPFYLTVRVGSLLALPLLAAFLVLSFILVKLHLHSLFFRPDNSCKRSLYYLEKTL